MWGLLTGPWHLQTKCSPPAIYCEPTRHWAPQFCIPKQVAKTTRVLLMLQATLSCTYALPNQEAVQCVQLIWKEEEVGAGESQFKVTPSINSPPPLARSPSPSQCCSDDKEDKQHTRGIKKLFTTVLSVKKHLSFNCLSTSLLCAVLSILYSKPFQSMQGQVLLPLLDHRIDIETQSELI